MLSRRSRLQQSCAIVLAAILSLGSVPISSPEGTATSHVREKGPLVLPPRSAIVQKVIFDTPDKQLIHSPDTPFRRFFDARSRDFAAGKLEEAKATILADIVALLRNRQYLTPWLTEVVTRHRDTAIAPQGAAAGPLALLQRGRQAVSDLRVVAAEIEAEGPSKGPTDELAGRNMKLEPKQSQRLRRAVNVLFVEIDAAIRSLPADAQGNERSASVDLLKELCRARGGEDGKKELCSVEAGGRPSDDRLRVHGAALEELAYRSIMDFANRTGTVSLGILDGLELTYGAKYTDPGKKREDVKSLRQGRASRLVAALSDALVQENYPDLRDTDIERILDPLGRGARPRGSEPHLHQLHEAWFQATGGTVDSPAVQALRLDLHRTLKGRAFFREVIDTAVDRRLDLFRGQGTTKGRMEAAEKKVKAFVRGLGRVGDVHVEATLGKRKSLWQSTLEHAARSEPSGDKTLGVWLVRPGTDQPLTAQERQAFGAMLRKDIADAKKKGESLSTALPAILDERSKYLRAATDATSETGIWKTGLAGNDDLEKAHQRVFDARKTYFLKVAEHGKQDGETKQLRQTYETKRTELRSHLDDVRVHGEGLERDVWSALQGLKDDGSRIDSPLIQAAIGLDESIRTEHGEGAWKDKTELAKTLQPLLTQLQGLIKIHPDDTEDRVTRTLGLLAEYENAGKPIDQPQVRGDRARSIRLQLSELKLKLKPAEIKSASDGVSGAIRDFLGEVAGLKDKVSAEDFGAYQAIAKDIGESNRVLKLRGEEVGAGAERVDAMTKTEVSTALRNLYEAADKLRPAEERLKPLKEAEGPLLAAYEAARGNADGTPPDSLMAAVAGAVAEVNKQRPPSARVDVDALSKQLRKGLFQAIQSKLSEHLATVTASGTIPEPPTLDALLTSALGGGLGRDVSTAKNQMIAFITDTFEGHEGLVASDDPVLKAYLLSGDLKLVTDSLTKKAAELVPEKMDVAGVSTVADLEGKVGGVLREPSVFSLFGSTTANAQKVSAFKGELFDAFHHRLDEALAAEREADYDYWWLTFHPKAVPLGLKKLDGASIIEVSFPEAAIPDDQYERWQQDFIPNPRPKLAESGGRAKRKERSGRVGRSDGGDEQRHYWERRLRVSTDLLRSFGDLLQKSALNERYPGVREGVLGAIREFALPHERFHHDRHRDIEHSAETRYRRGIQYLHEASRQHGTDLEEVADESCELISELLPLQLVGKEERLKKSRNLLAQKYRKACGSGWQFEVLVELSQEIVESSERDLARKAKWAWSDAADSATACVENAARILARGPEARVHLAGLKDELRIMWKRPERSVTRPLESDQREKRVNRTSEFIGSLDDKALEQASLTGADELLDSLSSSDCRCLFFAAEECLDSARKCEQTDEMVVPVAEGLKRRLHEHFLLRVESLKRSTELLRPHYQAATEAGKAIEAWEGLQEEWCGSKDTQGEHGLTDQQQDDRIRRARDLLSQEGFGLQHVLLAVGSAAEEGVALPEKVALLTSAFFERAGRFAQERSWTMPFVVPLDPYASRDEFVGYLKRKDVESISVSTLMERRRKLLTYFRDGVPGHLLDLTYSSCVPPADELPGAEERLAHAARVIAIDRLRDRIAKRGLHGPTRTVHDSDLSGDAQWLAGLDSIERRRIREFLFYNVRYHDNHRADPYLQHPELFVLQMRLDQARERLRRVVVDAFFSSYPGVPDRRRLQDDYLSDDENYRAVVYQWLRELWVLCESLGLFGESGERLTERELGQFLIDLDVLPASQGAERALFVLRAAAESGLRADLLQLALEGKSVSWPGRHDTERLRALEFFLRRNDRESDRPTSSNESLLRRLLDEVAKIGIDRRVFLDVVAGAISPEELAVRRLSNRAELRVQAELFLQDFSKKDESGQRARRPYLTEDAQSDLIDAIVSSGDINEWLAVTQTKQHVADQLHRHLLGHLYSSLWSSIDAFTLPAKDPVPWDRLHEVDYRTMRSWGRPSMQPGIQVVDMLPASRDDLVAISIHSGGFTAQMAAQADAAAVLDTNALQSALRSRESRADSLERSRQARVEQELLPAAELMRQLDETESISKGSELRGLLEMAQASRIEQQSVSGTARLGVYGRAKAAMAYSRRREYLDAAITAAGKGDNFAKWVVRRADFRSSLAGTDSDKIVAASHTGYPNGDQPFHVLVKIPHGSIQHDWNGKPYILFNSSYAATRRKSWIKAAGWSAVIPKGFAALVNPRWWKQVERGMVASVHPFMWDVKPGQAESQKALLAEPNILGGRLYLDDTNQIKYSEVALRIAAEKAFIQTTRVTQTGALGKIQDAIVAETEAFGKSTRDDLAKEREDDQKLRDAQREALDLEKRTMALEKENAELREQLEKATAPKNPEQPPG
ncbi:MAG: hypothetical protein AAF533_11150 [Acidobacteriota bacterium]